MSENTISIVKRPRRKESKPTAPPPRMRLLRDAIAELKAKDPDTAFSYNMLRRLVVDGDIPSLRTGNRYLVNMEIVERYLSGDIRPYCKK